jgi:hypothetical protein
LKCSRDDLTPSTPTVETIEMIVSVMTICMIVNPCCRLVFLLWPFIGTSEALCGRTNSGLVQLLGKSCSGAKREEIERF